MADRAAPSSSQSRLNLRDDGAILVPTNPEVARLRLAELEADPGYVEAIMNVRHPLHEARTSERQALMQYASRAAKPA